MTTIRVDPYSQEGPTLIPERRILAPLYPTTPRSEECAPQPHVEAAAVPPPRTERVRFAEPEEESSVRQQQHVVPPLADLQGAALPVLDAYSDAGTPMQSVSPTTPVIRTQPLQVQRFVAQSAFTQNNPFRQQSFADFASNPHYEPPPNMRLYEQASTHGSTIEYSRASHGEFLLRRLADAAHGALESDDRQALTSTINETMDKLVTGDWFYKWTRSNRVHRRYVWLHMQRGSLMWSRFESKHFYHISELKLAEVTQVKPDCIQDSASGRTFYRMGIFTADRVAWFATAIREKFDGWFKVLQLITLPNVTSGVSAMWSRPSSIVNYGHSGTVGRWASRYSPLHAIVDGSSGDVGNIGVRTDAHASPND